jgi:NDP-sugar pyrophosphorylase family protein
MVSDGTNCNDNRIGAVACIATAVRHFNINDDLLVIGGDTLFYEDFKLNDFMRKFESKCSQVKGAMVTRCLCGDHETTKYGILEIDADDRVTSFLEKPPPHLTNSRFSCPCFYVFTSHVLPLLHQFLEDHKDFPLAQRDAPGNFIKYLFLTNTPLYTYPVTGRHDVGNLESYIKCNMEYIPNY